MVNGSWLNFLILLYASYLLQEFYNSITKLPNRVTRFVKIIEEDKNQQDEKCLMWDQLAAACVIDEAVICETKKLHASVELRNSETRGEMVVDTNKARGKTENVSLVTKVNQALYEKLITAAFQLL